MLEDLQPSRMPELIEIAWAGEAVDIAYPDGIADAGFAPTYPAGVEQAETQIKGVQWHDQRAKGVVCRSASRMRRGFQEWSGEHEPWAELAIFVENARQMPRLIRRRPDLDWLNPG